jgi:hypothetical protein
MLRGHVAHQCIGRQRVFSSINAGAARLLVRFGLVAYVMGHKAAGLRLCGKWRARPAHVSAPDPYTHQGPSCSGTLLGFGPTRGLQSCMYIGARCPSVGSGLTEVWCLFLPRDALWPAHPMGSGAVLRVAKRSRMGAVSSCCRRGYP